MQISHQIIFDKNPKGLGRKSGIQLLLIYEWRNWKKKVIHRTLFLAGTRKFYELLGEAKALRPSCVK